MSNFIKRLPTWSGVSSSDNNYDGEGERKSSSVKLTLDSESVRELSKSSSSVWKPVWFTGWHTGVLASATSVVVVLLINTCLTIYVATNPEYKMESGTGTLYMGSCDKSRKIGMWLHLGINGLSTLLLAGSNYTQQCLAAPARSEIDAAHARRRWMDIGVPGVRNLFMIKRERMLLWIIIGFSSIPLHLLYNSAVYTSLAANGFLVAVVTNNFFEPGASSNKTEAIIGNLYNAYNTTNWMPGVGEYNEAALSDIKLFSSVFEGYNTGTANYEDLTPSDCIKHYDTDFLTNRRNLFLITKHRSNTTHNSTLLEVFNGGAEQSSRNSWMCSASLYSTSGTYLLRLFGCKGDGLASKVASGLPWQMSLTTGEEVEIGGCKSEKTDERCKVQFSLAIMTIVICCNLVKACCMVMTVVRSREPTLVTLGDAVDSFLRIPDPTTEGICFADWRFIKRKWKHGWMTRPQQWKQKGVQRWWTSVSKMRWIACNIFCLITIIVAGKLLQLGIGMDEVYWNTDIKSMWNRGFGKINYVSTVHISVQSITEAILIANLPQTILAFLYLTYNSLFTCMLAGHEWSLFSHHHRSLRVTSPRPGQRSTYWLQLPYTYAIPLMTLSGLLHWLTSQSLFLAKIEIFGPLGQLDTSTLTTVGYSCIAIICVLTLWGLALLAAAGIGYKPFAAEITTVGSCSAAISAACHAGGVRSEGITEKKVRWGDVGIMPYLRIRHLTFSDEEGVGKPVVGEVYAGMSDGL